MEPVGYVPIVKHPYREATLQDLRNRLTVKPSSYVGEDDLPPIHAYVEDDHSIYVGPSVAEELEEFVLDSDLSRGDLAHYPKCPEPRDEVQRTFFKEILADLIIEPTPLLARADTGFGKTVAACFAASKLSVRTLVVVTTKVLARQWAQEFQRHTGKSAFILSGWSDQGWKEADVTIAIVNTLTLSKKPEDFQPEVYGLVVWDEVHRMGAREFCKSLQIFPARYRLGLSATPKRKDGQDVIYLSFFGQPRVVREHPPLSCNVYTRTYVNVNTQRASARMKPPQVLNLLAKDRARNDLLAERLYRAWDYGRFCLGVSDRIEQLGTIKQLLIEKGVPSDRIGIIAGSEFNPNTNKRRVIKEEEEDSVKADDRFEVILGTYGKVKEGFNVPRLDYGIDLTPRADGEQMVGRIRRYVEGKDTAIWETILDKGVTPFAQYYKSRIRDLSKVKGVIIK